MKISSIIIRSAFAIGFALSFASCSLFDKADDVTFGTVFEYRFTINYTAEDVDVIILQTPEVLDAATASSDYAKYKDKIKDISITGVTYEIQNCTITGVILTDGKLSYSGITETEPTSDPNIGTTQDLGVEDIKKAENKELTLQFGQVALNDMSSKLKTDKEMNVYLTGTLSTTPAKFDVVLRIKANISADKL